MKQKKRIPNSRRGSTAARGGQYKHKRHIMEPFEASEITETVPHELDVSVEECDNCTGILVDTGKSISKDEFDVEIHVIKRRHEYRLYKCIECGAKFRLQIDSKLKEANQYGNTVQTVALSLMVTGNVGINKVRMLINGMTSGLMNPSEGFICKLYMCAAMKLADFIKNLRAVMIQRAILYWDDTVIMIKTRRACMRFYGDESISYYTAHKNKNLEGLLADDILTVLTEETTVMHDHNKVNYNEQFSFRNIECIQHLERDIQKVAGDNPSHTWSGSMIDHISKTIKERKDLIQKNITFFSEGYLDKFRKRMLGLINKGYKESAISTNPTTVPSEDTLLKRIEEYYDNYFKWVEDFTLPTTDNLSEHRLRGIKSHQKISGQFDSEKTVSYFAIVKHI